MSTIENMDHADPMDPANSADLERFANNLEIALQEATEGLRLILALNSESIQGYAAAATLKALNRSHF